MKLRIVFPSMPFDTRKIDPEFASEQAAVRLLGGDTVMFDFDLLKKGEIDEAFKHVQPLRELQTWTYRGWMMSPEIYEVFYAEMRKRGYVLFTTPASYSICHVYPLVYPYLKDKAVRTYVIEGENVDHDELVNFFEHHELQKSIFAPINRRLFVKDWVKSAKGIPGATVVEDYMDYGHVMDVTTKLRTERGDLFYYGFVFKEFIDIIKRPDGKDEEYRGFFLNDKLVTWAPAHGPGGANFKAPAWAEEISSKVPGSFYTIDFVFVEGLDGPEAIILEAGDGGVSGLSVDQMPITFYSAIEESLRKPHATV